MSFKPEIVEAMKRLEKALGSPAFPKFPMLDMMAALARLVGQYEHKLGHTLFDTRAYIEAGHEQIPAEEHGQKSSPKRLPLRVNVEAAIAAIHKHMDGHVDEQTQLNLFANVLGQLCALRGLDTTAYDLFIEEAFHEMMDA